MPDDSYSVWSERANLLNGGSNNDQGNRAVTDYWWLSRDLEREAHNDHLALIALCKIPPAQGNALTWYSRPALAACRRWVMDQQACWAVVGSTGIRLTIVLNANVASPHALPTNSRSASLHSQPDGRLVTA
jgi:hypothetical protein